MNITIPAPTTTPRQAVRERIAVLHGTIDRVAMLRRCVMARAVPDATVSHQILWDLTAMFLKADVLEEVFVSLYTIRDMAQAGRFRSAERATGRLLDLLAEIVADTTPEHLGRWWRGSWG